ncbi:16143_t:CDS:2 [Funneliformis mosseae]|uniref:16143_t:CDS:1 n=1 Tax=Funneliformis mosseae TaxID=27381 RepID=A0A9N9GV58_FUNMO|nr:16143_t:CDS:2 [Funneliformis mosseae]
MTKLHTYYVSNAFSKISYIYSDLTDDEFYKAVNDRDDNLTIDNEEILKYGSKSVMENYFNFDNQNLQKALEVEVRVVIEQKITNYDHKEKNYNSDALLNANFNK